MELDIDVLAALAHADDEIRDADRKRASARASVPNSEKARDEAAKAVADAKQLLATHTETERANQRKLKEYETFVMRANRALETGAGDADAAERQRVSCIAIIDGLETEQLELMDVRETLEAALLAREAELVAAEETVVTANAACAPEVKVQTARLMTAKGEAIYLRSKLHKVELVRYDALMDRNRRPVSILKKDTCKACNRVQVPRAMQELKRGRLVQCAGCGRWLHAPDLVEANADFAG
ncbi:MAG: putative nucleic acid-binding Zn-ribbon protein [Myxococcota bacterium]|jgi:predicted  nucleic acid-binding Zn-ribbon protein